VGNPVAALLRKKHGTVTQCHSKTPKEVMIAAVGALTLYIPTLILIFYLYDISFISMILTLLHLLCSIAQNRRRGRLCYR
jgi:hypothetical protein